MRRLTPLLFLIALASCGGGKGPLFADAKWAVRCEQMGGCVGASSHDVVANTGEGGAAIMCDVIESATNRIVNFSVTAPDGAQLSVQGAQVPLTGGPAGGSCQVRVTEGVNRYSAVCGSAEPSAAQPCRVNNFQFYVDDTQISWIEADIYCVNIPQTANPTVLREITINGEGAGVRTTPAHVKLANCDGLML